MPTAAAHLFAVLFAAAPLNGSLAGQAVIPLHNGDCQLCLGVLAGRPAWGDIPRLTTAVLLVTRDCGNLVEVSDAGRPVTLPRTDVVPVWRAVEYFTDRIRRDPGNYQPYHRRAMAWLHRGVYARAVEDLDAAVARAPRSASLFACRGVARQFAGDSAGALRDYDAAIRMAPADARPYSLRADLLAAAGDYEAALRDYDALRWLNPADDRLFVRRGNAHLGAGDPDAAIRDYDRAILARNGAAATLPGDAGDRRGAIGGRAYYVAYAPPAVPTTGDSDSPPIVVARPRSVVPAAPVVVVLNRPGSAATGRPAAPGLDREYAEILVGRGRANWEKGDYRRALADFGDAAGFDPADAAAAGHLAWARATCPDDALRDGRQAVAAAKRMCDLLGWHDPRGLTVLAAAHAEAGDFAEAVAYQRQALADRAFAEAEGECQGLVLEMYISGIPYRDSRGD